MSNKAKEIKNLRATLDYLYCVQGLTCTQVAKVLSIHPETAKEWLQKENIPTRDGTIPIEIKSSRAIGYLCGLVIGDGSLNKQKSRNYSISLESTKPEMTDLFRTAAKRAFPPVTVHTYSRQKSRSFPNGTFRSDMSYIARFDSKIFFEALRPFKKADYHWGIPTFLNTPTGKIGFLQGLYDAEGSVQKRRLDKKGCSLSGSVNLSSKHTSNLTTIRDLLEQFGISSNLYHYSNHAAQLNISGRKNKGLFAKLVGFKLRQKATALFEDLTNYRRKSEVTVFCKYCGKPYTLTLSDLNRGRGSYCSLECYWQASKGRKHTPETIQKMSLSKIGPKNPMYGRNFSEEHKRKLGEATKRRFQDQRKNQEKKTLDLFQQAA